MDAKDTIAAINAALTILDVFGPRLAEFTQKGEITIEQQAALKAKIDALRSSAAYGGTEWKPSTG